MELRHRASPEQFSALTEFMERHGDLGIRHSSRKNRSKANQLWVELRLILNSLVGEAEKPMEHWKKVWEDWKNMIMMKAVQIFQEVCATGCVPSGRHPLSVLEVRVVAVIGLTAIFGLRGIQEAGLGITSPTMKLNEDKAIKFILRQQTDLEEGTTQCPALEARPLSTPEAVERPMRAPVVARQRPTLVSSSAPQHQLFRDRRKLTSVKSIKAELNSIKQRWSNLEETRKMNHEILKNKMLELDSRILAMIEEFRNSRD